MKKNYLKVEDYFDLIKKFDHIGSRLDLIESLLTSLKEEQKPKKKWLDVPAVCQLLNVSKRTLQAYRDKGTIKSSKIGGKVYFKASEIEAILSRNFN